MYVAMSTYLEVKQFPMQNFEVSLSPTFEQCCLEWKSILGKIFNALILETLPRKVDELQFTFF
jgi:hypothetical protein